MKPIPSLFIALALSGTLQAQPPATVREYTKEIRTYPFSDPDPVPSQAAIYPYYRFDGFTNTPVVRKWKVVELENDFIRVVIMPEIGGKIWTAIDKTTGHAFIYDNSVVKFRDVAMRGPWTSGGIEPNYGIIGHTPNCATPVDYAIRRNEDGSASCFVGVLDLLTRTRWQMEVRLPRDKAWFSTGSVWSNPTGIGQPYYHWMNTGIRTKGDLEFIFPGTAYIGHEGEHASWPVNEGNGKRINFYEQNDFGTYKSYHVIGRHTDFFGAYWHSDANGMVRYAPYDEKAGKKIWIWGLSRQGMIWERMLTDTDGQYAEIQSGRLFNQNARNSTYTPFKHLGFTPHTTDRWTEYWYPVKATRGMVVANEWAALNIREEDGWLKWYCSPAASFKDVLEVEVDGKTVVSRPLDARPLQTLADSVRHVKGKGPIGIGLRGRGLYWSSDPGHGRLSRPLEAPGEFDWQSAEGLALMGKELMDQKMYREAEASLRAALEKSPNNMKALVKLAELSIRNGAYGQAFDLSRRAVSIDAHDGMANYLYGLSAAQLGRESDALDGLGIASMDAGLRTAAHVEIARIHSRASRWPQVAVYAEKASDHDRYSVAAAQLRILALRKLGDPLGHDRSLREMEAWQPLNPFIAYERGAATGMEKPALAMQNEMPWEGILELASFYLSSGATDDGRRLLSMLPENPQALYWRAWLDRDDAAGSKALTAAAEALPTGMVFPFRSELLPVMEWASAAGGWKARYYLALLLHDKNRQKEALESVRSLEDRPDAASFYSLRAIWEDDEERRMRDIRRAIALDAGSWRYRKQLAVLQIGRKEHAEALKTVEDYIAAHGKGNFVMDMLHAKTLLLNRRYRECDNLLAGMDIIPFEGATEGRALYWEAKMMMAVEQLREGRMKQALALVDAAGEWPEHLGVGKPYDSDIDARLEEYMRYLCLSRLGRKQEASAALDRITGFNPGIHNTVSNFQPANHLVSRWAMEAAGRAGEWEAWMREQERLFPRHAEAFARVRKEAAGSGDAQTNDDPWGRVIRALASLRKR